MPVTRLSPITVGCLVVAIIVIAAGVYILSQPRRHDPTYSAEPASQVSSGESSETRSPEGPHPLRSTKPPDISPHPPPARRKVATPPSAALANANVETPAADGGAPTGNDKVAIKNRQLLIAAHNLQLVQQADERAFDTLKLSESVRVAIRTIDEAYGKKTQEALSPDPERLTIDRQIGLGIGSNEEAERIRRAAIKDVLGLEGAQEFAAAEYAETRRLRIQYRKQWAEELDANAPRPPGMPRTPH
jgi:hypothetical protein